MKINVRLLIITFVVIAILSFSSTIIYYSTTTSLLKTQHSKTLLNSKVDFSFAFQNLVSELDSEMYEITEQSKITPNILAELDFIFRIDDDRKIIPASYVISDKIILSLRAKSLDEFLIQNPNIILKYFQNNTKEAYFYGKIIDEEVLNIFSEKIRAEVVLVINKIPYTTSNKLANEIYLQSILEMMKSDYETATQKIFFKELQNGDFFGNSYSPELLLFSTEPIEFVIFNLHTDLLEFREKMQIITILIALSGVLLSFIFIILFTTKIRKQISLLSQAAKITSDGDLSHRVPIISKDELGNLGRVFNDMLENIQENEKIEREYSELITIINQTPQLKTLSDEVLQKVIETTKISFGVFYLVEKGNAQPISTYGINLSSLDINNSNTFYSDVLENQKTVELNFDENPPTVKTGIVQIKIKYLLIMPIIFNNVILGIIELACEHIPKKSPVIFLNKIKEQLAIGLSSALSYERLENLVNELRLLNDQYQKQNIQISDQNSELINLHEVLKKQADELERQRKSAVELSHVKSQFLANMSHELRTPLNSILGLTELIAEDSKTFPKTKDRLKIVFRSGKKLLTMINNILEFSKIESGKYEVTKSNFVLSDFMLDIFNSMEPLVTEKGLNFEIIFESEYDLLINSDRHKLEQIVLNLISNAIKFTEVGGIKIALSIHESISLKIDIQDTGIGISVENQSKIFDEFEQVDYTSSRKYQGAGLGLAICKKYVELINGKLSVSSELSTGSSFSVVLNNAVLEKFSINKSLVLKNTITGNVEDEKNIIIIQSGEDNSDVLSYFGKLNYNVIESKDGELLIDEFNFANIDGLLLYHDSKNEDSWNLIYDLRTNPKFKEIPLFLLTPVNGGSIFYSTKILEVLTSLENSKYVAKTFERIEIQYNSIKTIALLSRYNEKIKTEFSSFDYQLVELTEELNHQSIESSELIITDFLMLDPKLLELAEEKNIPIIIYFDKASINQSIAEDKWGVIAKENGKPCFDVFENVSLEISKRKNIIRSTIAIDDENVERKLDVKKHKGQFSVMVVDDDQDTQFTVGEILQNIGCEIFFANNGAECLNLLKDNNPDLILLDIMMPIMDGFETIKKIRTNENTKDMQVYAITAQAMLDEISIIKSNGFDDLITKPVNASTLSFKIQQAIEKRVK